MPQPHEVPSITDQLQGFDWSSEEAVAYEAAIEAVNGAVGAYSALIAAEESLPTPDRAVVQQAKQARARLAEERQQLDPTNHAQIAEARAHYAELARRVVAREW